MVGPQYGAGDWQATLETTIEWVDPTQLLANPANARRHPGPQRDSIRAALDKLGWVAPVIVNRTTQHVLDGHLRVEEAITRQARVPVAYVEIPDEDEAYVLATYDQIGLLAAYDQDAMVQLLDQIGNTDIEALDTLLADLADIDLSHFDDKSDEKDEWDIAVDGGTAGGDFDVRSIILAYDTETYTQIIAALNRLPGETNADKVRLLILG